VVAVTAASALAAGLLAPVATADNLSTQRDKVRRAMSQTQRQLNESARELSAATAAVERAQSELSAAQQRLAATQAELAEATRVDRMLAAKLRRAQVALAKAKAAVIAGQKKLDAEKRMAGNMMRDQYQQQTNLLPIAILTESSSTADLQTRLQWSTTMFDTTKAQIDRLTVLQRRLNAKKARQAALEKQIAEDRKIAAANLQTKKRLERRAAEQRAAVADLVRQRSAAEAAAADEVAEDKRRYAALSAERASVEQRIAARIAKARAAARAARLAAARAERAEQRRRAAERARGRADRRQTRPAPPPVRRPSPGSGGSGGSGGGFSYPVSAPITSAYGMRFHPVLHYWKLHDGTDFGAGCGAPIRAPYGGRVSERYYNPGYGNRLMIDHGLVNGRYVTTGYNHAISYTVGVGQWVSRGQVIGYVGTTGYSTGCHLHLMLWLDGAVRNPMTWF
jgi:murein DD-endopeptidase MepM/ murein hydrolase activator NlpD